VLLEPVRDELADVRDVAAMYDLPNAVSHKRSDLVDDLRGEFRVLRCAR
jgi:hypothetical protein